MAFAYLEILMFLFSKFALQKWYFRDLEGTVGATIRLLDTLHNLVIRNSIDKKWCSSDI